GLDTSLFIYHFEAHPAYVPLTRSILDGVATGARRGIASELVLLELLVKPFRLDREDLADQYEVFLAHFPNLEIRPVGRNVARTAARIRANHGFAAPDAIHLANAVENGATIFVCNDKRLRSVKGIEVLILDDYS
ncbi:MAG: PIN domain-containing protein, partial [Nitrospirota bacterium]